jgi:cytochrome c
VPAGPDYKALITAASLEEGKGLAVKCTMCHDMTNANKTLLGPPLFDMIGRDVASMTGFNYSAGPGSLSAVNGAWDYAMLDEFLENPKKLAPNTVMLFPGMKREGERMALIAYIRSLTDGEPKPLP